MAAPNLPAGAPLFAAGDILVRPSDDGDGCYQVSRVSANGHSLYVMGVQRSQLAALQMANRATSGLQRVFLASTAAAPDYRLVND